MTQAKQSAADHPSNIDDDDMLPEYHLSGNGVRGKFAQTLRENGYSVTIRHQDGTSTTRHVSPSEVLEQQRQREQLKQLIHNADGTSTVQQLDGTSTMTCEETTICNGDRPETP